MNFSSTFSWCQTTKISKSWESLIYNHTTLLLTWTVSLLHIEWNGLFHYIPSAFSGWQGHNGALVSHYISWNRVSWQFHRPIANFSNDISWVGPNAWLGKGRPECMPWKFSWHLGFPKKSLAYLPLTTTEEFPSALGIKALFTKYCWYSQSCKPLQSRVQYKPVRKHSLTEKAQEFLGLIK